MVTTENEAYVHGRAQLGMILPSIIGISFRIVDVFRLDNDP